MTNSTPPLPSGDDLSVRLGELLAKATPTPWVPNYAQPGAYARIETDAHGYFNEGWVIASELLGPDAEANIVLIVEAINALPQLLAERAALNARVEEARGHVTKLLAAIDAQDAEYLGESIHAGFRKGSVAADAGVLWKAIADSRTSAWTDALEYHLSCVDFHFGDDIRAARAYLTKEASDGRG